MSYIQEICPPVHEATVGNIAPEGQHNAAARATKSRDPFHVTRSTVALSAYDLMSLDLPGQVKTLVSAIRAAGRLNRTEVLVERLDCLPEGLGTIDVAAAHGIIRSSIQKAFTKLCLPEPRIALEKWSYGYELRIYLAPLQ